MKALTVHQPWAWLLAKGIKDVENRSWGTDYRGRLLIHAGQTFDEDGYSRVYYGLQQDAEWNLPDPDDLRVGVIVGSVELVRISTYSDSPWYEDELAWHVQDAEFFDQAIGPVRGHLGLWKPTSDVLEQIAA